MGALGAPLILLLISCFTLTPSTQPHAQDASRILLDTNIEEWVNGLTTQSTISILGGNLYAESTFGRSCLFDSQIVKHEVVVQLDTIGSIDISQHQEQVQFMIFPDLIPFPFSVFSRGSARLTSTTTYTDCSGSVSEEQNEKVVVLVFSTVESARAAKRAIMSIPTEP